MSATALKTFSAISIGASAGLVGYKGYGSFKDFKSGRGIAGSLALSDIALTGVGLYYGYKAYRSPHLQASITKNIKDPLFTRKLKKLDKNSLYTKSFDPSKEFKTYKFDAVPQRTLRGHPISKDKISFLRSEIGVQTIKRPTIELAHYGDTGQRLLFRSELYGRSGFGIFKYNNDYSKVGGIPYFTETPRVISVPISRALSGQELSFTVLSKQATLHAYGFNKPIVKAPGGPTTIKFKDIPIVKNYAGGNVNFDKATPQFANAGSSNVVSVSRTDFQNMFSQTVGKHFVKSVPYVPSEVIAPYIPAPSIQSGFISIPLTLSSGKTIESKGSVSLISADLKLATKQEGISLTKTLTRQKNLLLIKQETGLVQEQGLALESKGLVKVKSKGKTRQKAASLSQSQSLQTSQVLEVTQRARAMPKTISKGLIIAPVLTTIPAGILFPFIPGLKRRKAAKPQGYDVLVRRKGQFFRITDKPLIKAQALSKGRFVVGNTAAATFRLQKAFGSLGSFKGRGIAQDFDMKIDRRTGGIVHIEKARRRIKSSGELREITYKGIQANRTKSRKTKRSKLLTKNIAGF